MQHSTAQHNTAQHQHYTAQHNASQHVTAHLRSAQHSTAQHSTLQRRAVQLHYPTNWKHTEHSDSFVVFQIHLELAKYNEIGRLTENEPDMESALYHLELAATCGVVKALLTMAEIFLQLPHEILDTTTVQVSGYGTQMKVDLLPITTYYLWPSTKKN